MESFTMSAVICTLCLVFIFIIGTQSTAVTLEQDKTQASGKKIFRGSCKMDVASNFTSGVLKVELDQQLTKFKAGKNVFDREDPLNTYYINVTRPLAPGEEGKPKFKVAFSGVYTNASAPTGNCTWDM